VFKIFEAEFTISETEVAFDEVSLWLKQHDFCYLTDFLRQKKCFSLSEIMTKTSRQELMQVAKSQDKVDKFYDILEDFMRIQPSAV